MDKDNKYQEQVHRLLDGEFSPSEAEALHNQMRENQDFQREYARQLHVRRQLMNAPRFSLHGSDAILRRAREEMMAQQNIVIPTKRVRRYFLIGVVTVTQIILVVFLYNINGVFHKKVHTAQESFSVQSAPMATLGRVLEVENESGVIPEKDFSQAGEAISAETRSPETVSPVYRRENQLDTASDSSPLRVASEPEETGVKDEGVLDVRAVHADMINENNIVAGDAGAVHEEEKVKLNLDPQPDNSAPNLGAFSSEAEISPSANDRDTDSNHYFGEKDIKNVPSDDRINQSTQDFKREKNTPNSLAVPSLATAPLRGGLKEEMEEESELNDLESPSSEKIKYEKTVVSEAENVHRTVNPSYDETTEDSESERKRDPVYLMRTANQAYTPWPQRIEDPVLNTQMAPVLKYSRQESDKSDLIGRMQKGGILGRENTSQFYSQMNMYAYAREEAGTDSSSLYFVASVPITAEDISAERFHVWQQKKEGLFSHSSGEKLVHKKELKVKKDVASLKIKERKIKEDVNRDEPSRGTLIHVMQLTEKDLTQYVAFLQSHGLYPDVRRGDSFSVANMGKRPFSENSVQRLERSDTLEKDRNKVRMDTSGEIQKEGVDSIGQDAIIKADKKRDEQKFTEKQGHPSVVSEKNISVGEAFQAEIPPAPSKETLKDSSEVRLWFFYIRLPGAE